MKRVTSIYLMVSSALIILTFNGCLKDTNYNDYLNQSLHTPGNQNIIELKINATSASNFTSISFDAISHDTTVYLIPVNLASADAAPEDIHVTLIQNAALVSNYNDSNGTDFQVPDSSTYALLNTNGVVTIPKGSHTGYLQMKFTPANFIGTDWAFGYTIKSVQESGYAISGNFNSGILAFGIKNKYDGRYVLDASSSLVDLVASANNSVPGDPYPYNVDLVTTSGSSVAMYVEGDGYLHLTAGGGAYGEFDPVFTFDNANNIISVTNKFGQPSPTRNRAAQIDQTGLNKQNTDQSIDVKYVMTQQGTVRTQFSEHLIYVGPR